MTFRASGGMRKEEKGVGESYLVIEPLRTLQPLPGVKCCRWGLRDILTHTTPTPEAGNGTTGQMLKGSPGRGDFLVPTEGSGSHLTVRC